MPDAGGGLASAQVVLRPATGEFPFDEPVTAANIARIAPAPEAATEVAGAFRRAGFEVGAVVGNSFSITASVSEFEKFFAVRLGRTQRGGLEAGPSDSARPGGELLPLGVLSESVARHVMAVTFVPPPAFGPTGDGP